MPLPSVPDLATALLEELVAWIESDPLPPVDRWHPAACGAIDIHIAADGRWYHEGKELTRPAMVRAFGRILRREADGTYVLVTPAEKVTITVEDAPLLAVEARIEGSGPERIIILRTNIDNFVAVGPAHPLLLRDGVHGRLPYLHAAGPEGRAIEARLSRGVYYELAEHADADGRVWSNGMAFALGEVE